MITPLRPDSHVRFIRTPRYLWPFNSESSAFWPPLGFCSLAGALRDALPSLRLSILDCPIMKMGWKTLERALRADPPDVVCVGEETVSSPEGRRLAGLVKRIDPGIIVVAGGVYFSYAVEETFSEGDVDFIVRGEGERALVELVRALMEKDPDPSRIEGLAYRQGERVCVNPLRAPIHNLDDLPWPAYDLLPVDSYGRDSLTHPRLACLEHSRGCVDQCSFCILWKHFGKPVNNHLVPCYRTKSAERSFAEVEWLAGRYGRKTINFVDPCFNADPGWTDRFAQLLLASDLRVDFTAWMRADFIVRDEGLGLLEKLVRAGLRQVYIGIERTESSELQWLNKHHNDPETTRRAFEILRRRYPVVFTIGTIMFGMPWESRKTLARLIADAESYPVDYTFFIPLAPNPGTEIRAALERQEFRMSEDFREYNFFTPVVGTQHLSRSGLENFYSDILCRVSPARLRWLLQAFSERRGGRNRQVFRHLCRHALKVGLRQLAGRFSRNGRSTLYAEKPDWYDS